MAGRGEVLLWTAVAVVRSPVVESGRRLCTGFGSERDRRQQQRHQETRPAPETRHGRRRPPRSAARGEC